MKKSVLIRVDASFKIGYGHLYRMISIADQLNSIGATTEFLVLQDEVANRLLATHGHPFTTFRADSPRSEWEKAVTKRQPDLLLNDQLDVDADYLRTIRRDAQRTKIVTFDDLSGGPELADAVINPIVFCWGRRLPANCKARIYEGPEYMILNPSIRALRANPLPRFKNRVVLSFGGSDTHNLTERVLGFLLDHFSLFEFDINLGPGARPTNKLDQHVKLLGSRARLHLNYPNLPELFARATIAVCSGGVTLFELAALGTPAIAVAAELHEIHNVRYWASRGSCLDAGHERELTSNDTNNLLSELIENPNRRLALSAAGQQALDGRGIDRCLKILNAVLSS